MPKVAIVVIEDAWRLKGRKPPKSLDPYISLTEWAALCEAIHHAILPAVRFKALMALALAGLFAMPLLSIVFLWVFVLTGILEIDVGEEDEDGEFIDNMADQEAPFRLMLFAITISCLGLATLCLLLGSAIRYCCVQRVVESNLVGVFAAYEQWRERDLDLVEMTMTMDISQPKRVGLSMWFRSAFMAWCDLDFDLRIEIRDSFDDYSSM